MLTYFVVGMSGFGIQPMTEGQRSAKIQPAWGDRRHKLSQHNWTSVGPCCQSHQSQLHTFQRRSNFQTSSFPFQFLQWGSASGAGHTTGGFQAAFRCTLYPFWCSNTVRPPWVRRSWTQPTRICGPFQSGMLIICIYINTYYVCMYVCMYERMNEWMNEWMNMYMYMYMYVYVYVYVCKYVSM